MNPLDIKQIKKLLKNDLDKHRYKHSLGVAHTAMALSMCYGSDINQAEIAGLLHDCAKCFEDKKKISICIKNKITFSNIEEANPYLLHCKVGSFIATQKYGIKDMEITNAIMYHTTGREKMSLLEKIIFVADYIEPGRRDNPRLKNIRQEAFSNLDIAIVHILEDTLEYLNNDKNKSIHPATERAYHYYKKGLGEQNVSI